MNILDIRALRLSLIGLTTTAALLFIPAGTFDYWQAWVFMAVFAGSSAVTTIYLAIHDPKLLERRMHAGPSAEKEPAQKIIMSLVMLGFYALLVFSAFDHRQGWSAAASYVSWAGDALIVLGFFVFFLVLKVNSYSASTVQISEGQKVITTGPYARVRHPMYAGALPLIVGVPLALGSWWGLCVLIVIIPVLIWRLLDEESFLGKNLPGYTEYRDRVRYRLLPYIW